jgi:hypothetical protein
MCHLWWWLPETLFVKMAYIKVDVTTPTEMHSVVRSFMHRNFGLNFAPDIAVSKCCQEVLKEIYF